MGSVNADGARLVRLIHEEVAGLGLTDTALVEAPADEPTEPAAEEPVEEAADEPDAAGPHDDEPAGDEPADGEQVDGERVDDAAADRPPPAGFFDAPEAPAEEPRGRRRFGRRKGDRP